MHFVLKNRETTRLQRDERDPFTNQWAQFVERCRELPFCPIQQTVVVQRPAAADLTLRYDDVVAGIFEHFDGSLSRFWVKIVVPGVGPENDALVSDVSRPAARVPCAERAAGKHWDPPLWGDACEALEQRAERRSLTKEVRDARRN